MRTNPQIEKDRSAVAVRIATLEKQKQLDDVLRALAKSEDDLRTLQQEHAQLKAKFGATVKEKDGKITASENLLSRAEANLLERKAELEGLRRQLISDPEAVQKQEQERLESEQRQAQLNATAEVLEGLVEKLRKGASLT